MNILQDKHPVNQPPFPDMTAPTIYCDHFHFSIFQFFDEDAVRRATPHMKGAADQLVLILQLGDIGVPAMERCL